MKIYKLIARIYDYWYDMDRDGFREEEYFFSSKEKAERWAEDHKRFAYAYEGNEAKKDYEMPSFKIEEIEVL